ncbi:MAG: ribosome silencing factor [Actinomycetota bacterium]
MVQPNRGRKTGIELVWEAARAASDKKAERVTILDVSRQLVITDHFLICSGNTERQVRTIADEIERRLIERVALKPLRREGQREARWVVLDFVDFIVHVFHKEEREYYNLERLWADADITHWEDENEPAAAAEAP